MKARYIAAALTVAASVAVTPACVDAAYAMRGYKAYGGECLVIPLGIAIALVILEVAKVIDEFHSRYEETQVESYIGERIGSTGAVAESEE